MAQSHRTVLAEEYGNIMAQAGACSTCGKDIQTSQSFCPYCGSPQLALLSSRTTSHIPELPSASAGIPNKVIQLTRIYADIIVFQVAGYEQPVLVKLNRGQITVGRHSTGELPPALDLNPYNGGVLGVSRQHAVITRAEKSYTIKDIGSTNGTWLNDQRLTPQQVYPLASGDILRFAQVAISVYFRNPGNGESNEDTLALKYADDDGNPFRLTLERLQSLLIPFLTALTGFQQTLDTFLGHPKVPVDITNITVDAAKSTITVKMTGLDQTHRLLAINLAQWRKVHDKQSAQIEPKLTESGILSQHDTATQVDANGLQSALRELAAEILKDKFVQKPTGELSPLIPKLVGYLETLATSTLEIVTEN